MDMIPPYPLETGSNAEKKIFDRLSLTFENKGFTAFHSMNLTRHGHKRFGEIDFLITGPAGIFVLEIKGGRVGCKNGIWQFTDRYGKTSQKLESPFQQARGALHGLMDKLRDRFDKQFLARFPIGYAVICPDCRPGISGAEWDGPMLMDASDINDLGRKFELLFTYWQAKHPGGTRPGPADLDALNTWLRPAFESACPLFDRISAIGRSTARLTRDQMVFLDVIRANPQTICRGGAGTGKTFLAMELARLWTAQGMEVAMPCESPWLSQYLEHRFPMPGLTLTRANAMTLAARRMGITRFDALIVDEGQDLLNMESLDAMDRCLKGGLDEGQWAFFHDINNQSGMFRPAEPAALQRLARCKPARVPLTVNCRNTLTILDAVKQRLDADMGVRGAGKGPAVRETTTASPAEAAQCLAREIRLLLEPGQLPASRITILSAVPFKESSAALLPRNDLDRIIELDPWAMRHFPPRAISFARIHEFKGLENAAVIVIDLPEPGAMESDHGSLTAHYVAMSRARYLLSIIYTRP